MSTNLDLFERVVRSAHRFTEREPIDEAALHPFDRRNLHPKLPAKTKELFDDGHYAEATFETFKYLDRLVAELSKESTRSGEGLMMAVFGGTSPRIRLTPMKGGTEIDEQRGYQFLFAGSVGAIRNPRGHESGLSDDIDTCLDHLCFASMLLRRLEDAGLPIG